MIKISFLFILNLYFTPFGKIQNFGQTIQMEDYRRQWTQRWHQSVKPNGFQQKKILCGFCKRNGETAHIYESHTTKDAAGNVICPYLYKHVCELCGATGPDAHTRSYCQYAILGRTDPFFKSMFVPSSADHSFYNMVALKKTRVNSAGKVRRRY